MKKAFLFIAALAFLTSCEQSTSDGTENNGAKNDSTPSDVISLEVRNESSITMTDIKWNDETFSDGENTTFTPGSIFTKTVSKSKIESGIGYIFFTKSGLPCRTQGGCVFCG